MTLLTRLSKSIAATLGACAIQMAATFTTTLVAGGAGGVIAGCTEIELLVGADDVDVAYFPTARIHALAVVEEAFT